LEDMTGVKQRRLYPAASPPSRGAVLAAQTLFRQSGYKPEDVDLLYSTSVGRDFLEPSTASIIHSQLGLPPGAASLDLGSACLGFIDGIFLAALQVEMGLADRALVVAGENARAVLESTLESLGRPELTRSEFFRHFATLTLGSGGAAMLLGKRSENSLAPRVKRLVSRTDPTSNDLCRGTLAGMETDPALLLVRGVALAKATFAEGVRAFNWKPEDFDLIISHQVSEVNTRKFAETVGFPWDKVVKSYPEYGNMGPVAVPFTFALAAEMGLIKPQSTLALMGIGSGLTCAMLEVEIP
jgi:3-oxoacyl-[acyl-carrier-protein] synthase-3